MVYFFFPKNALTYDMRIILLSICYIEDRYLVSMDPCQMILLGDMKNEID